MLDCFSGSELECKSLMRRKEACLTERQLSFPSERNVNGFALSGSSPFGTIFTIIVVLVLIATWVILATSRFTQGLERWIARAHRALLTDSLGLLLAVVLFAFHWRWVRRLGGSNAAPSVS